MAKRLSGKKRSKVRRPKPRPRPHPKDGIPKRPRQDHRFVKPPRKPIPQFDPFANLFSTLPALPDAIVWTVPGGGSQTPGVPDGTPVPYSHWSTAQKQALKSAYNRVVNGTAPQLSFLPKVKLVLNNAMEVFATRLPMSAAWKYFLYYVAQSLAVESRRLVPWSLRDYTPAQLAHLFNSNSLFYYSSGWDQYVVTSNHPSLPGMGASQPGDPVRTFAMLQALGLVGVDRVDTILRTLDWCRANLVHFYGGDTSANYAAFWQYGGYPPIDRVLNGTTHQQYGFHHWTAGCWGTGGFLRNTLRTVNIAVSIEGRDGHALPHFHLPRVFRTSTDLYLSHGDDPYNWGWISTPPVPIAALPIDDPTFQGWFGSNASLPPGGSNVGRQTVELSIQYLSNYLLRLRCGDIAAGRAPAQSQVFDMQYGGLGLYYTVAQLQAMNLWQNLDARIAALGGCANIP
jgi:hypothetical protein